MRFERTASTLPTVNAVREWRRRSGLTQAQCAQQLGVPLNSFRMWDSGLRPTPPIILQGARAIAEELRRHSEQLPVRAMAAELGIHRSTLEAAIRTGRLRAHYLSRSVFGRPIRRITRADAQQFMRTAYGRKGAPVCAHPLPDVPSDCSTRLKRLRQQLGLTQTALAEQLGAANKAVVYQWESRKRAPSPVFWQKIQQLEREGNAL